MILKLDMVQAAALAVAVLFIGHLIKRKLTVLDKYCIPAPVIGGILFAITTLILKQTNVLVFEMDVTLQKFFMTAFFTTIGFTASFKLLKKGGKQVFIFLGIAVFLVICQNITGVVFAKIFGLNPLIGLSTGSVPMVGGHGTAGAFGPVFEEAGAVGANTVAMASATFGLIMGSMLGGPIAKKLIDKHNLAPSMKSVKSESEVATTIENDSKKLLPDNFMHATTQLFIAMGVGTIISYFLEKTGITFPAYIGAMFAAAIIRNLSDSTKIFKIYSDEIDIIGNVSLAIFLSMALMGLKLWQLADLALPLIVMLAAQAVIIALVAYFITFNVMGRDYEAAVMSGGTCGFGMGATPNAMANMEALTKNYGIAPRAFFIVPLVGSLFIDFFNAGIVTMFMNFFA